MDMVNHRTNKTGIITEVPVRHGKSEYYGKYVTSWFLNRFPDKRVGYISYADEQARIYGRATKDIFNETAPILNGLELADDSKAANRWNIKGHDGGMFTAGMGGQITGKGFHLLIIDDPVKNDEEAASEVYREHNWNWFHSTAMRRLEPGGFCILNMTRWHTDDLVGRVREMDEGKNKWVILSFPAIAGIEDRLGRKEGEALWPMRFPLKDEFRKGEWLQGLESIRDSMALYWWYALYQQKPTKHDAVEWPPEYFEGNIWFDHWPDDLRCKVITLDPSKGRTDHSDYRAYIMLGLDKRGHLWVDADLERESAGQIVGNGIELIRRFRPQAFGIEGNAWQDLLAPMFGDNIPTHDFMGCETYIIDNSVMKENRIRRIDPWLRLRKIHFKRSKGSKLLIHQLREFPMGEYDDGPDALEMALRLCNELLVEEHQEGITVLRA